MDTEHGKKAPEATNTVRYHFKTLQTTLNLLIHLLIGIVVGSILIYCFRFAFPLPLTITHIVLCVIGYQLLMAQAILSLSPHNGWSAHLKIVDKKRAHWILQVVGSALAIAGSFLKIVDKSQQNQTNWSTKHGIFALVALIFTVASFVNGLTSLYAYELRKYIPAKLSKITHIIFGVIAFGAAGISLCYGLDKGMFRSWIGTGNEGLQDTIIAFNAILTILIIVTPLITCYSRLKSK